jgi:hypothetical protein
MTDSVNWKQVYHWANIIIISLWAIVSFVVNSGRDELGSIVIIGSIWIILSGVINSKVRKQVLKFLGKFTKTFGCGTFWIAWVMAGFALLYALIVLGLIATFVAMIAIVGLALYLFITSFQAIIQKNY